MRTFSIVVMLTLAGTAHASQCAPAAPVKEAVLKDGGRWIEVTPMQHAYLLGYFNATPPAVDAPYGDRAVLMSEPKYETGIVGFLDGDMICNHMVLPKRDVEMFLHMDDVTHETPDGTEN